MVKAMQDPEAGIKLTEFGTKRGKGVTKYFTGKNMIDWLMSWSFAKDRSSAAVVATDMLRNGFFHTVNLDASTSALMLSKDELLSRHVVDNEDSNYVFVSMTSANSPVFDSDDDSSSDSDDDILFTCARTGQVNETGLNERILKQGFLLKKGKVLKEWKPRRFVLKEHSPHLFFYRGSKGKKHRGCIPLSGLTVVELDDETGGISTQTDVEQADGLRRKSTRNTRNKVNRILLITATGERIVLEAPTAEERSMWTDEIKLAVASLEINN
jgi:hypothetical protein